MILNRDLIKLFAKRFMQNDLRQRAYGVAFNFTLSLFPATIFFFSFLTFVPIQDLESSVFQFLDYVSPANFSEVIKGAIMSIASKKTGGFISVVFLIALYLSTNGMMSLMGAFNRINKRAERRSYFKQQLIAFVLVFISSIVLIVCIVSIVVGSNLLDLAIENGWVDSHSQGFLINSLRFLAVSLVFLLTTSIVYRFAPSAPRKWNIFSKGAWIATLLIILSSILLSFYIDFFGTYNLLYGSIGVILGVMFWMFLIAISLLVGYQINEVLAEFKMNKGMDK